MGIRLLQEQMRHLGAALSSALSGNCPACHSPCGSHPLCHPCRVASAFDDHWRQRTIGGAENHLTVYALGLYRNTDGCSPSPGANLLRRFKYSGDRSAGRSLVGTLARSTALPFSETAIVVPIPLHRYRLRQRGFNQAAWIARAIARRNRMRLLPDVLACTLDIPSRARLSREARRSISVDLFCVRRRPPDGSIVLLVDDVCTTGATLCSARLSLEAAGLNVGAAAVLLSTESDADAFPQP